MTGHEAIFRRLGVVVASSLGAAATCKLVELGGNLGEDSVVSVMGELATVPAVLAAGVAAMLGMAWVAERNDAHYDQRESA